MEGAHDKSGLYYNSGDVDQIQVYYKFNKISRFYK